MPPQTRPAPTYQPTVRYIRPRGAPNLPPPGAALHWSISARPVGGYFGRRALEAHRKGTPSWEEYLLSIGKKEERERWAQILKKVLDPNDPPNLVDIHPGMSIAETNKQARELREYTDYTELVGNDPLLGPWPRITRVSQLEVILIQNELILRLLAWHCIEGWPEAHQLKAVIVASELVRRAVGPRQELWARDRLEEKRAAYAATRIRVPQWEVVTGRDLQRLFEFLRTNPERRPP